VGFFSLSLAGKYETVALHKLIINACREKLLVVTDWVLSTVRKISIKGKGDGTGCALDNQLWVRFATLRWTNSQFFSGLTNAQAVDPLLMYSDFLSSVHGLPTSANSGVKTCLDVFCWVGVS
jgi:hypothetical protein